jgi:hypothetical protein
VNSPGGNVFDGQHIHNALVRQREEGGRTVEVDIEALAASAATLVTSAGDPIRMPRNALMFVHNPLLLTIGNAKQLREDANLLDKVTNGIVAVYRKVSKLTAAKLQALMDQDTWMDADEALANGFITEVTSTVAATAHLDAAALDALGPIPDQYRDRVMALIPGNGESTGDVTAGLLKRLGVQISSLMAKLKTDGPAAPDPDNPENTMANQKPKTPLAEPQAADAKAIVRMCREGGHPLLAESLLEADATIADVEAAIGRAKQITDLCATAKLPDLAASYIEGNMSVDAVRAQLAIFAATADGTHINGHVDPEAETHKKPRIDYAEVYGRLNGVSAKEH